MTATPRQLLAAIDATCRLADAPQEWLSKIAGALSPAMDQGVGVQTLSVSFGAQAHTLSEPMLHGGTSRWNTVWKENWWRPVVEPLDSPTFLAMLSLGPFCSAQQLWARLPSQLPLFQAQLETLSEQGWSHAFRRASEPEPEPSRLFYLDSLNLFVHDRGSGEALCVVANRSELVSPAELAHARKTLSAVVPQLRSALRARGRSRTKGLLEQAAAIFSPDGSMLDASGSARCRAARLALRDAVCRLERVRAARTDGQVDDALRLWQQLGSGNWSIVDAFDSGGRRYLVALPNDEPPPRCPLSPREDEVVRGVVQGLSNKAIAWELGLSTPTVSTLISRAYRKLGVTSRAGLIRLVRARDPQG